MAQFGVLLALLANRMDIAAALAVVAGVVGAIAGVEYAARGREGRTSIA